MKRCLILSCDLSIYESDILFDIVQRHTDHDNTLYYTQTNVYPLDFKLQWQHVGVVDNIDVDYVRENIGMFDVIVTLNDIVVSVFNDLSELDLVDESLHGIYDLLERDGRFIIGDVKNLTLQYLNGVYDECVKHSAFGYDYYEFKKIPLFDDIVTELGMLLI